MRINKASDTPVFNYWTMNNELVIMANQMQVVRYTNDRITYNTQLI